MPNNNHEEFTETVKVLQMSSDRAALERAATALGSSHNPEATQSLAAFLRSGEFLARLDDQADPSTKMRHLCNVMAAVESHPSARTAELCLTLGADDQYLAYPDRKIFLLPALAAVRPMTKEAVAFFRRANEEGYFSTTAPLLIKNGSPLALELFEAMMQDRGVAPENRVDALHTSVLAHRTELPVLESCARLLAADLEQEVAVGVIETVFDFRSREWFGPAIGAPVPPPWEIASNEALELVVRLAEKAKDCDFISMRLRDAVNHTLETVRGILANRAMQGMTT